MASANKSTRTIYYFRCNYLTPIAKISDGKKNLQEIFASAWEALGSIDAREFTEGGKRISGMGFTSRKVHLSTGNDDALVFTAGLYEEGASASTLPKPKKDTAELTASSQEPPSDHEFLDGKAFALIYQDNLLIGCTGSMRSEKVIAYIRLIISKGISLDVSNQIDIRQISEVEVVKDLIAEGVNQVVIDSCMFSSSFDYIKRNSKSYKPNKIVGYFKKKADEIVALENEIVGLDGAGDLLNSKIVIGKNQVTKEISGDLSVGEAQKVLLKKIAEDLTETPMPGYTIITKGNKRITHDKIVMTDTVKARVSGKTVNREDMWDGMANILGRYQKEGRLKQ